MRIRPILLSKSTVFSRSKICIFSLSDPRFGVKIWSDKVSSISLKFYNWRGKRLSLSIQKEFLKLIDTEQSYSALLAHNFERQFSFDIFITHTDNCPFIPRIGLLRYTAHRLKYWLLYQIIELFISNSISRFCQCDNNFVIWCSILFFFSDIKGSALFLDIWKIWEKSEKLCRFKYWLFCEV